MYMYIHLHVQLPLHCNSAFSFHSLVCDDYLGIQKSISACTYMYVKVHANECQQSLECAVMVFNFVCLYSICN